MRTEEAAKALLQQLRQKNQTLSTAESCTGGGIGHVLTSIPGSSSVYVGGLISYTNRIKHQILQVPIEILDRHGAVSLETAAAMAEGCQKLFSSELSISVTGLAGPDSDESGKPVGLVYIGIRYKETSTVLEFHFSGDREAVRDQAISEALQAALSVTA